MKFALALPTKILWICILLLLCFFFASLGFVEGVVSVRSGPRGRRALYSDPSSPEEVKRVVRIETFYSADRVTDVDFCTGALLNESIVLTAAHCIYRSEKERPIGYIVFGNGQMVSGGLFARHPRFVINDDGENETLVAQKSDYSCYDVALLFLNAPIKIPLSSRSPRLEVDCNPQIYLSGRCFSHGAGITESGKLTERVLKVPLPKIKASDGMPFDSPACLETRYIADQRLCQGDSGGPVFCAAQEGIMSVIGINVQIISREEPKSDNPTELCKITFGSIISNTRAITELVSMLPAKLQKQVRKNVKFQNCENL